MIILVDDVMINIRPKQIITSFKSLDNKYLVEIIDTPPIKKKGKKVDDRLSKTSDNSE